MIYPLDRPRIQVLDPAERHEGVQEPLLLSGKRPAQTVAHQERLAQRAIIQALLERGQRHGEVVEPVTVTTVVEIDGAGDALVEQKVPVVQVGMDQPENVRPLSQFPERRPHLLNRH